MPFVKLDCGMLDSTLWVDPVATKVFLTALLMAVPRVFDDELAPLAIDSFTQSGPALPRGEYGFVEAAGIGIVRRALVPDEAGIAALRALCSPDMMSRSTDNEGRRLARVDGGFVIINYMKYREKDHSGASRQARYRQREKARQETAAFAKAWESIVAFYGGVCAYCRERPWTDIDHVVPTSKGGEHVPANVVPACRSCNSSKGARAWEPPARHPYMPPKAIGVTRAGDEKTRHVTQADAEADVEAEGRSDSDPTPPLASNSVPPLSLERSPSAHDSHAAPQPGGNGKGVTRHKQAARRCPSTWSPTGEDMLKLRAECQSVDLDRELRRFRDCEFRVARSDWDAAWRNWVRRAADDLASRRPGNALARRPLTTEQIESEIRAGLRDENGSLLTASGGK